MVSAKDFKPYKKTSDISYTIGVFPTIELINQKPNEVVAVLYSDAAQAGDGFTLVKKITDNNNLRMIKTKRVQSLTKNDSSYVVGVFKKYRMELSTSEPHIVLVEPDDMGNIGTIVRSMAGFGYRNLAIVGKSADFWHPKSIRACMGSIFRCNIRTYPTIQDYQSVFPKHRLYAFMLHDAKSLSDAEFHGLHSLVFGNEGAGLPHKYSEISQPIYIEQSNNIDSLNLSVAASVAMHWAYSKR